MKKTQHNLMILNCIFAVSLVISNILASKVVSFMGIVTPAAIVAYPITFLITDVIGEMWGKEEANKTVKIGFVCQAISLVLIGLAVALPVAPFAADFQTEYENVLGQSARVVAASLIAYLLSQFNDVFVFHKLKEICKGRHKWLRNNASTMISQIVDTAIFVSIAFYGTVPNVFTMIISQYAVKFCFSVADTPLFLWLTRNSDKQE